MLIGRPKDAIHARPADPEASGNLRGRDPLGPHSPHRVPLASSGGVERRYGRFWLWDARVSPEGIMIEDSADLEDILTVLTAEVGVGPEAA